MACIEIPVQVRIDAMEIVKRMAAEGKLAAVEHGVWGDVVVGPWGISYATCSHCRRRIALCDIRTFYPGCGAKMDGGEDT